MTIPYRAIQAAIERQQCVVLDGAMATALPHLHGQQDERPWAIEALASGQDDVRDVHRRYLASGADVLTTNTWGLPTLVARGSELDVHWMEIARRGVRVAREAIAAEGREGECAVAFSLNADLDGADGAETVSLLARALANDAPDVILFETLSVLRPSLFGIVEALLETGIPLWLSFRRCRHGLCGLYGQHWGGPEGDAFGRAARRFEELGVGALLVNCIPPDHVPGIVGYLRDFTDLPLGVYPNLGYYTTNGWRSRTETGAAEYARMALSWRAEGAQIIGGCCGTGPEHIEAASAALAGAAPARTPEPPSANGDRPARAPRRPWTDRRERSLYPLPFPTIARHDGVTAAIPGSYLLWRHLFERGIGAQQRCLDVGSGAGLQTVQLALNGALHVHALDVDERAVANTLDTAFRNGVADRVSAETGDLYPWVPGERYELIVANLPQLPADPARELDADRQADYWGRGLVDQLIRKLPEALADEGVALVVLTSLISAARTRDLLAELGMYEEVVDYAIEPLPRELAEHAGHLGQIEQLSDAHRLHVGDRDLLAVYLLEIRRGEREGSAPWQ
jgi:S-methylmethionine-dependent homocysteine/selenocysteine methylase